MSLQKAGLFMLCPTSAPPLGTLRKLSFFSTLVRGGKALSRLLVALIGPYVKAEGYLQEGEKAPPNHR